MKRLFDIIVSALVLLVLLIPFLIIAAILKLTGEHKVWYLQDRVGQCGQIFRVYKFVTMREGSEMMGSGDITVRNDPRVLPVGRVLRKAKINELPQFINVLIGQMSLVGPRPLVPRGFGYYPEHVREQLKQIKPGITGVGSIIFRDEEAIVSGADKDPRQVQIELIAPYKGELELWYQRNQSFWLDLKILLLTALVVLRPSTRIHERWLKGLPPRPAALG